MTKTDKTGRPPRIPAFIKRKRFYIPALIVALVAGYWFLVPKDGAIPNFETAAVERGDVLRVVSESGTIEATSEVDLAFTASGRITSVNVSKGDQIRAGQIIARINSAQAAASLEQAQAALRAAEARSGLSGNTLAQTKQQQDQAVASARQAYITGDLQAYLVSSGTIDDTTNAMPPTISGTYRCEDEGEYRLSLYASAAESGSSFRYSGIESGTASVNTYMPTAIGSCGLFAQFPENFVRGRNTEWSIPIPNTRSATYLARRNAYESALEARDLTLTQSDTTPMLQADIDQARAAVRIAETALAETVLRAPFSGLVTELHATLGAIATPGAPMLSLTSTNQYEISVSIPEDAIYGVDVGDRAEVVFEALNGLRMDATVIYVAPTATTLANAVSFEVILQLNEEDDQVRAGLTADIDIFSDHQEDVLIVPVRAVVEENGEHFVRVMVGETSYREVPVTVGLRGSGLYEITGGLEEGQQIITFANSASLNQLTNLTDQDTTEVETATEEN